MNKDLHTQGIGKMAGVVWDNGWRWIFILVGLHSEHRRTIC